MFLPVKTSCAWMENLVKIKVLKELQSLKKNLISCAVTIDTTSNQKRRIYDAILKIDKASARFEQLKPNSDNNNEFQELIGKINQAANTARSAGNIQDISKHITRATDAINYLMANMEANLACSKG